jgi:hypothetical protein
VCGDRQHVVDRQLADYRTHHVDPMVRRAASA